MPEQTGAEKNTKKSERGKCTMLNLALYTVSQFVKTPIYFLSEWRPHHPPESGTVPCALLRH